MAAIVRFLRSASTARAVLIYLAVLCGVATWLPWVRGVEGRPPPAWAIAVGLDHPFSSAWLLGGVAALFASTLACTWGKRARTAQLWRGELPGAALRLGQGCAQEATAFLHARGFRGSGPVLHRHRWALWGGLVLHWGLLALIAGVGLQQAFHDEASFQLAPGESRLLADPGAVFQRVAGPLAPASPPALEVVLEAFDPFRHQPGYAPDRLSTLLLRRPGGPEIRADVDRASGARLDGVKIHQAIPAGLAAVVESPDGVRYALHLATLDPRTAAAERRDPSGRLTRLVVSAERGLEDPQGTGRLEARLEQGGATIPVAQGQPFSFGGAPLRIVQWTRWAGFTYSRSPGLAGVFGGFLLLLVGAGLLTVPAGVARLPGPGENATLVWLPRGWDALRIEWERGGGDAV